MVGRGGELDLTSRGEEEDDCDEPWCSFGVSLDLSWDCERGVPEADRWVKEVYAFAVGIRIFCRGSSGK